MPSSRRTEGLLCYWKTGGKNPQYVVEKRKLVNLKEETTDVKLSSAWCFLKKALVLHTMDSASTSCIVSEEVLTLRVIH